MYVFHATWEPRAGLFLWAEDVRAAARGAASGPAPGDRHPFAASAPQLAWVLEEDLNLAPLKIRATSRGLWLPSARGRPLPSPELVAAGPAPSPDAASVALARAELDGLLLEPPEAGRTLAALAPGALPPGTGTGAGVRFLRGVLAFADDLLARGRVLPAPEQDPAHGLALRWRPSLRLPEDRQRLEALAEAFPPAMLDVAHLPMAGARAADARWGARNRTGRALDDLVDGRARERLAPHAQDQDPWRRAAGGEPLDPSCLPEEDALRELDSWRKAFDLAASEAYRLVLTLREPTEEAAPFQLAAAMGPRAAPEESTPLPAVLAETPEATAAFADSPPGWAEQARTWIDELAEAFPPARALRDGAEDVELAPAQAARFLEELAPDLRRRGARVVAPSFWMRERPEALRVRVAPRRDRAVGGAMGVNQVCHFDWNLALDGEPLTRSELAAAAEAQGGLVALRGRWRRLEEKQVRAARRLLEAEERADEVPEAGTLVAWMRWVAGLDEAPLGLEVEASEGEDLLATLLDGEDAVQVPEEVPGFAGRLRPYQARGVSWLATMDRMGLGACLADDMGLGKTVQVLALLLVAGGQEGPRGPTLLVCPTSLLGNWEVEAARFAPTLKLHTHHGPSRLDGDAFAAAAQGADLVLTSYPLLARDQARLGAVGWRRVVYDEAQNLKNPDTRQARAARGLRAPGRIALTGTPVENRLLELWALMRLLEPGLLGGQASFRKLFATPIEKRGDEAAARALRGLTGPFLLRRRKTDPEIAPELPEKLERTEYCALTPEQAALYQATVEETMTQVEGAQGMARRGAVLAALTRLKQVCNHPAQVPGAEEDAKLKGRSGKLSRLEDLVASILDADEKVLVFTQYRRMGEIIQDRLKARFDLDAPFLHGGASRAQRDEMVNGFQSDPESRALVLSLKAGGTGLNLTAATHVVHYDRWWNPAVEDQASDRAYRIGQRRDVEVHRLVCRGTLEERIDKMLEEKRGLAEAVVGAGETWLTELSTEDLRDLVSLGGR